MDYGTARLSNSLGTSKGLFIYDTSSYSHILTYLSLFALKNISQSLTLFSEDHSEH